MINTTPKISVIIPTYNRGDLIKRTINSVLEQTYTNFELLIVDDASTDNTAELIKSIDDTRIRYLRLDENTKGTRPRNLGIEESTGEFIAFLDSDDEWLSDKLEKQVEFMLNSNINNNNVLCFTGIIIKNGDSQYKRFNRELTNNEDIMDYILVKDNIVQTSTYIVSSKIAKSVQFDSQLKKHQDWDFCLRLRNNNVNFLYFPQCLTVWYVDESNNRLSYSYQNEDISLNWLNAKKSELSSKSVWAFKARILVDGLVYRKEYFKAIIIALKAFFYRSINLKIFLKIIVKILFTKKMQSKIKKLAMSSSNIFSLKK